MKYIEYKTRDSDTIMLAACICDNYLNGVICIMYFPLVRNNIIMKGITHY